MSKIWFISDIHGGHENQIRWRPGFKDADEIWNKTKANYNAVVRKRDTAYFLGDIAFTHEHLWDIQNWNGAKKVLIVGNHDTEKHSMRVLCNAFDEVHSLYKYKEFWLSHAPVHPDELRGKVNIHGHTHFHVIDDDRYVNVCLEQTNYRPVELTEVRQRLLKLK